MITFCNIAVEILRSSFSIWKVEFNFPIQMWPMWPLTMTSDHWVIELNILLPNYNYSPLKFIRTCYCYDRWHQHHRLPEGESTKHNNSPCASIYKGVIHTPVPVHSSGCAVMSESIRVRRKWLIVNHRFNVKWQMQGSKYSSGQNRIANGMRLKWFCHIIRKNGIFLGKAQPRRNLEHTIILFEVSKWEQQWFLSAGKICILDC